jgi:hypothetical protein
MSGNMLNGCVKKQTRELKKPAWKPGIGNRTYLKIHQLQYISDFDMSLGFT